MWEKKICFIYVPNVILVKCKTKNKKRSKKDFLKNSFYCSPSFGEFTCLIIIDCVAHNIKCYQHPI